MTFRNKVEALLGEVFEADKSLFLIDFKISTDNKIKIIVDGDKGLSLEDCMKVSRHIEHNLDREEQDFSLEVMSPGADEPIQNIRQYKKNVGRNLKVKALENENFEGKLTEVDEKRIKIEWKAREPKPIGKGKVTVLKEKEILFLEILEARVKIIF